MRTGSRPPIAPLLALALTTPLALGCIREASPYPAYGAPGYAQPGAPMGAHPHPHSHPYGAAWGYPPATSGPHPSSGNAAAAIGFAQSRLGAPYCWGGNGPSCYDCSGLTHAAWLAGGKSIPRTSAAQVTSLPPVAMDQIIPGDILWRPGHVGLYVGNGWVIAATKTGDVVRYQAAAGYERAVRP